MTSFREATIRILNDYERQVIEREKTGRCDLDKCDGCDLRGYCDRLRGLLEKAAKE